MKRDVVGLDRKLELDWLDAAAARVAGGDEAPDAREYLWRLLEGTVSGDTNNSARGKTVSILSRVWLKVPEKHNELRDRAAELASKSPADDRKALHWAMLGLAYPLFFEVAEIIGRLTTLEDDFTLARLQKRLTELWGDRATIKKASQRIVRMMIDWGALTETDDPGRFRRAKPAPISSASALVLFEAALRTLDDGAVRLTLLMEHPAAFPFVHDATEAHVRAAASLDIHRDGAMTDVVELR